MKLHKRIALLLSTGIMGIGLISFQFSPAAAEDISRIGGTEATTNEVTPTVTAPAASPTATQAPSPTPEPNLLIKQDEDSEVQRLIERYLEAKLSCDKENFTDIVSDTSFINEELLQQRFETIIGFSNITCYTKTGFGDIDYVVYYTYYSQIINVNSLAISIDRAFVYRDAEGAYRVFIGEVSDSVEERLNTLNYDEDVKKLINDTYALMEAEAAEDETLLAYWVRAYSGTDGDTPFPAVNDEESDDNAGAEE